MSPRKKLNIDRREVDSYIGYCRKCYSRPSVKEFAFKKKISRVTLSRRFKERYGITLSDYFLLARHDVAERLLTNTGLDIEAIAKIAGYGTRRNLELMFAKRVGKTPARYRRSG